MGFFGPPNVQKMKAKRDVSGLIRVLWDEDDVALRKSAAEALGEIGNASVVEELIAAFKHFSNPEIRSAIAKALGTIGDNSAIEPLLATLPKSDSTV